MTYTPLEVGSATHALVAAYSGELGIFQGSEGALQGLHVNRHGSETILRCDPATVSVRQASTCTATVIDRADTKKIAPSGTVTFGDGAGLGTFGGNASHCVLSAAAAGEATCQIAYMPSALDSGTTLKLTASYQRDANHEASQGTASLQVTPVAQAAQPPNTTLKKRPRKKTASRKATFKFVSDQPGSTFHCKLDRKPFRPCHSPFTKKVRPGRHVFRVRAVNAQGIADPTPAVFRWTIR